MSRACSPHFFHAGKRLGNAWGRESVKYLLASTIVHDQPRIPEDREVIGDGGHVGTDQFGQVRDAALSMAQDIDDQQTTGVTQGFEDVGAGPVFLRGAGRIGSGFWRFRWHVLKNGQNSCAMQGKFSINGARR